MSNNDIKRSLAAMEEAINAAGTAWVIWPSQENREAFLKLHAAKERMELLLTVEEEDILQADAIRATMAQPWHT